MKMIAFEGTPEEFQASGAHSLFEAQRPTPQEGEISEGEPSPSPPSGGELTPEIVVKALSRCEPTQPRKDVMKAVLMAGDAGISSADLAQAVGLTRAQVSGIMGALGRLVAGTEGWPKGVFAFDYPSDGNGGWKYRHWPVVREVLESGAVPAFA